MMNGSFLGAGQIAPLDILPIHDFPDLLHVIKLHIFVVNVKGMFPHVDR